MIKDECVRPKGYIWEPCSDISTNCRDMRSGFGYKLLYAIGFGTPVIEKLKKKINNIMKSSVKMKKNYIFWIAAITAMLPMKKIIYKFKEGAV